MSVTVVEAASRLLSRVAGSELANYVRLSTARGWSGKEATIFTTLQQKPTNVSLDTRS